MVYLKLQFRSALIRPALQLVRNGLSSNRIAIRSYAIDGTLRSSIDKVCELLSLSLYTSCVEY